MANISLGLYLNGIFIEDIIKEKNVTNTNKYGFKMFPTGSKFNDPTEYRPLTWEDGYTYVTSKGGNTLIRLNVVTLSD